MFFADGNYLHSRQKMYAVFMSQNLLLMAIFFILDRHFLKTSLCFSLKLCINIYLLLHRFNKLMSVFHASVLLLIMNFVITVKVAVDAQVTLTML